MNITLIHPRGQICDAKGYMLYVKDSRKAFRIPKLIGETAEKK